MANPWEWGWEALVAIGTIFLGAATLVLGGAAWAGNRLTRRSLRVAETELKATLLPIVEAEPTLDRLTRQTALMFPIDYRDVGGPSEGRSAFADQIDVYGYQAAVYISVPIHNNGPGIARMGLRKPRAWSPPAAVWTQGAVTRALVPARESARVQFRMGGVRDELYVEVFYTDMNGEQPRRTRLYVSRETDEHGNNTYRVRGTAIYADGETPAIAGDARVTEVEPPAGLPAEAEE